MSRAFHDKSNPENHGTKQLEIFYTPVEIVDFILESVNELLDKEFGKALETPGVHILDPFAGKDNFIVRLLQSRFMDSDFLVDKYKNELHANEIVAARLLHRRDRYRAGLS